MDNSASIPCCCVFCVADLYHLHRPHQGLDNVLLDERDKAPPELLDTVPLGEIVRHDMLGGLLKHYERKAA
jgi:hypothetical protein